MPKQVSAQEAVSHVRSFDVVWVHSNANNPAVLLEALAQRGADLEGVEMIHLLTIGAAPHLAAGLERAFVHRAFFMGANAREAVNSGRGFYHPCHLSRYAEMVVEREPTVGLLHVSPPRRGCYSLGASVEAAPEALASIRRHGGIVIAQVNPRMPFTHGSAFVREEEIDYVVEVDEAIPEAPPAAWNDSQRRIGELIAEYLIEDGSTLQVGIGAVPDAAVAMAMELGRKDLGVHTELYTESLMRAQLAGVINNRRKAINRDYSVAGLFLGTRQLYEYIHDNPSVQGWPNAYTNDARNISANPDVVAINSAIGVDLNGSVFADSLAAHRIYSGYGGQCDFMRGAAFVGPTGKPGKGIIALESTYEKHGETRSKITCLHPAGMNITVNAADPAYVVTEYGIVRLTGLALGERMPALCAIAHPRFRDQLREESLEAGGICRYVSPRTRQRGLPDGVLVQVE